MLTVAMTRPYPVFGEPICQWCERPCERNEVVNTAYGMQRWELWCYCPDCDTDTFHPPIDPHAPPPAAPERPCNHNQGAI
jgi:hypothetical protein